MTKHKKVENVRTWNVVGLVLIVGLIVGFFSFISSPAESASPITSTGSITLGGAVSEGNFNDNARVAPGRVKQFDTPEEGINREISCKKGFSVTQVDPEGNVVEKFCRVNVPHPSEDK